MKEACEVIGPSLPSRREASEVVQPSEEALDFPAALVATECPPVLPLRFSVGEMRRDEIYEVGFERFGEAARVVGFVADELFWAEPAGDFLEGFFGESALSGRCAVDGKGQRNAVTVDNCHDLGALSTLCRTDSSAPFFAGTKVPSMKPSSSLSLPRRLRSVSSVRLIWFSVPSRVHCWNRRWHVAGEGYRFGKSCQGAPVRITHKMPLSTSRGSRHGRPRPSSRTTGLPSSGSSTSHCASVRSAINTLTNTPDSRWKASPNHGTISITCGLRHL